MGVRDRRGTTVAGSLKKHSHVSLNINMQPQSCPRTGPTWVVLAGFALLGLLTQPFSTGDTVFYVSDILTAERTGDVASLFEFGHLLWRPAGLGFHFFTSRALPTLEPELAVFAALLVPVVLGAALAAVLFFRISWLLSGSYVVSGTTTVLFVCANGFLNYSQTGCPYVAALGFLTASVWIVLRAAARGDVRLRDVIASGACLAGSVLLWFPFATVAPGLAMLTLLYGVDWNWKGACFRRRLLRTTQLTGIVCALTGLAYIGAFRSEEHTNMAGRK